ncbi:sensor histidine kinase [Flavobacterium sp.]|uniref:sensor histidine kinase n=1 Tax=Flavobacterium sp. TaxID=239 RepID=UPI0039E47A50
MKFKHQLSIFNALTRLLVILVLWLLLPVLVEKVVSKHINQTLLEKKQNFIAHLDNEEINDFLIRNDTSETYSSYSTLHSEFLQLSLLQRKATGQTIFLTEPRVIEEEQNDYRILQYEFEYDAHFYLLEIGSNLSEIEELTFVIRVFILIVLVVILLVTFLMDTFYIEYLLKPFYKIIDTKIRRVDQPEKFDHTPIASTSADFEQLDTVLNQMMDRIGESFRQEKQFIANVSHELLTPIALLKGKFENLLQNDSLDDAAIDKIAGALRTLDLLKKVINNLLLISRIENNQYEANEIIHFAQIVENLIDDLADRIEEKGLSVERHFHYQPEFKGNGTLIHILLYNLVVNAIKYNKPKGKILVEDGFSENKYFIAITDTGIGMEPHQVASIFTRFTRISSDQEGQGLGLAIAHTIAHFHHLTIEVYSTPGQGTTFTLLFN